MLTWRKRQVHLTNLLSNLSEDPCISFTRKQIIHHNPITSHVGGAVPLRWEDSQTLRFPTPANGMLLSGLTTVAVVLVAIAAHTADARHFREKSHVRQAESCGANVDVPHVPS